MDPDACELVQPKIDFQAKPRFPPLPPTVLAEKGAVLIKEADFKIQTQTVCCKTITAPPGGGSINLVDLSSGNSVAETISKKRKLHELSVGRALYLFAGPKRRSTIGPLLQKTNWIVDEVDILQGGKDHDLTRAAVQDKLLQRIAAHHYDLLLSSPPCDTFSRVKYANSWGPKPTRSMKYRRGFPWLEGQAKRQAHLANCLVDFHYKAMLLHLQHPQALAIAEFPEDLGAVTNGPHKGIRPASVFQWEEFHKVVDIEGVVTGGIRQTDFGEDYLKPTRLILRLPAGNLRNFYEGKPTYDDDGRYLGPIPKGQATRTLAKTSKFEPFRTTGTAAWPLELCEELAALATASIRILRDLHNDDQEVKGGDIGPCSTVAEDTPHILEKVLKDLHYPIVQPPAGYWIGGVGPPRTTQGMGRTSPFFDGCGLTSPGRWEKGKRRFPDGKRWEDLRASLAAVIRKDLDEMGVLKHVAALAVSKDIFNHNWVLETRQVLHSWMARQCGSYPGEGPPVIAEGQPFYLDLIKGLLAEMRDADFMLYGELAGGVTLGVLHPLPHTPALYELQTAWRLKDDPLASAALENPNYKSIDGFVEVVEKQFQEERLEGWMDVMANSEFEARYKSNSAISALAVLEERDKLRVLHDGSNITRVNYRIKCRDRQRMPTVREKHCILDELRKKGQIAMAVLADASKAHRRVKVLPSEWGFLGCRLRDHSVWINKVQTFGIASAAYWWGRTAAGIFRCMYGLLGGNHHLDFLLFADDGEFIAASPGERFSVLLAITLLLAMGMPFKWAKFRGGFEIDWVGYHISYRTYSVGLSAIRAQWVSDWTSRLVKEGQVMVADMCSGLGRLNYAAQALFYERAFLGILYLWTSTVVRSGQSRATIPWAVRLILKWMGERIMLSSSLHLGRLQAAPDFAGNRIEWFRSDAKAEGGRAWVGGWEIPPSGKTSDARWYSVEVLPAEAPWVFAKKGDPQRVIAALELLGSLLCIVLFDPGKTMRGPSHCILTGATDNLGNSFIVRKLASTKWPITTLLVELSEQLRVRGALLDLTWVSRDDNVPADALTNLDYSMFNGARRIDFKLSEVEWLVLPELMKVSEELYSEICAQREKSKGTPVKAKRRVHPSKKLKWTDPW